MKHIQKYILGISCLLLFCTSNLFGQDNVKYDLSYEVKRVYPSFTIDRAQLTEANTLVELHKIYKEDWVDTYNSVEISAVINNQLIKKYGQNDLLTPEQKDIINRADKGSDISVKVKYIPKNELRENEEREMNFKFKIDPEKGARFANGDKNLDQYLKSRVADKLPPNAIDQYNLLAVNFTVNQNGEVVNAELHQSSEDKNIDQLLIKAIEDMPQWEPAQYADGTTTEQDFVLAVGDMSSCIINVLNVRNINK